MLRKAADERVAAQGRRYFRPHERVALLGVATPRLREIEKEIFAAVKPAWSVDTAVRFCATLIRSPLLEVKAVGVLLLSRYREGFDKSLFERARFWLASGYCGNWASTDILSGAIVAPLLARFPELLVELPRWAGSGSLWVRRASAVSLTPLARRGEQLDVAYAIATVLLRDPEDLMHKAVGWLLRECGKTDERRLEAYLISHGPQIPRTAVRYAIERFPADRRKRLLALTRPDK